MASSSSKTDAANAADNTTNKATFQDVADGWNLLSSGKAGDVTAPTITSELLNFFGALGKLAKNLGDVLSVVNKYI